MCGFPISPNIDLGQCQIESKKSEKIRIAYKNIELLWTIAHGLLSADPSIVLVSALYAIMDRAITDLH